MLLDKAVNHYNANNYDVKLEGHPGATQDGSPFTPWPYKGSSRPGLIWVTEKGWLTAKCRKYADNTGVTEASQREHI